MDRFRKERILNDSRKNIAIDAHYLSDELWTSFRNFYQFCLDNPQLIEYYNVNLPEELILASYKFFEEIKNLPHNSEIDAGFYADCYFENFTSIWIASGQRNKMLFYVVFNMVRSWEKRNNRLLHKGTLFYFWAATDIIHGDYDEGIILMHKALEEDRRKDQQKRTPDTPAYYFISMNNEKDSYLKFIIDPMVEFLKRRLEKYNSVNNTKLDYETLRNKFLSSTDELFEDSIFFFSFIILKWWRLRLIHKQRDIAEDKMAPLIITGVISDTLLIIDELFKKGFKDIYQSMNRQINFSDHLFEIAKLLSWTTERDFSMYQKKLIGTKFNDEITNNFEKTVEDLTNQKFKSKQIINLEADFWLCYGLRNFSAHSIKSQKILWVKYTDILQSLMNVLFLAIEKM